MEELRKLHEAHAGDLDEVKEEVRNHQAEVQSTPGLHKVLRQVDDISSAHHELEAEFKKQLESFSDRQNEVFEDRISAMSSEQDRRMQEIQAEQKAQAKSIASLEHKYENAPVPSDGQSIEPSGLHECELRISTIIEDQKCMQLEVAKIATLQADLDATKEAIENEGDARKAFEDEYHTDRSRTKHRIDEIRNLIGDEMPEVGRRKSWGSGVIRKIKMVAAVSNSVADAAVSNSVADESEA